MKKILFVMITIFLLPIFVYADDNNLVLKSIILEKLSEDVEELSPARIENNKINLDLKMYEVGDTAEYIVTVENTSDKDLYIEKNLVNTDKSTVIEKNSEKEFLLKVKYQNEVAKENFFSAKFKDTSKLSFLFTNSSNPETKRNIILFLFVIIIVCLAFKYQKKNKIILLLFVLGIIPIITIAENNDSIPIYSNITIKKVIPNPCTFDGELVQGVEYTNGQYTYRYMQEGKTGTEWKNINNDGWGVILTDKDSEEDVTTKLCTSINDKPIVSMRCMFSGSKTKNIDFSSFDTSNVTNMYQMLAGVSNVNEYDLSSFDTSNVTSFYRMFAGNSALTNIDLHYFDTSNVTDMNYMFLGAVALEEVTLDGWDLTGSTSGNSILISMFSEAENIKNVSMRNWKVSLNFTSALGCRTSSLCSENLEYIDVTGWDLSKTENISGLFAGSKTKEIKGLDTWDTSNITKMHQMFYDANKLESLDLSSFDTSNVTDMGYMFYGTNSLHSLDLSNFDTSKVTYMSYMFSGASSLEEVNLDGFDLTASTSGSNIIFNVFSGATNLKKVSMRNWKIPEEFTYALGCRVSSLCSENLEYIDVTGWDLSIAENLNGLFSKSYTRKIKGLETWDTSNVNDMSQMFYSLPNITTLDLSNFDTSNVINMNSMFADASSLRELNLSNFDTSRVTNMYQMFSGMCQLKLLDLSDFDTSNVTHMNNMFYDANSLKTIKVSDKFQTDQVTNSSSMFSGAASLVGGNGTVYDANHIDKEYARIDTLGTPGYFTSTD